MALHSLYCADVPLRNCSLTHVLELLHILLDYTALLNCVTYQYNTQASALAAFVTSGSASISWTDNRIYNIHSQHSFIHSYLFNKLLHKTSTYTHVHHTTPHVTTLLTQKLFCCHHVEFCTLTVLLLGKICTHLIQHDVSYEWLMQQQHTLCIWADHRTLKSKCTM